MDFLGLIYRGMKIPFKYGELVHQVQFVNRNDDKKRLAQNLKSGLNTMLISPRRWGKASIPIKVISQYKLGSSSNISRIKGALEKKEIIDTFSAKLGFLDPAFQLWFEMHFK